MPISISSADIKRKAMIDASNTNYDSLISSLISEMLPPLQYSIADCYLTDTSNSGLQATLSLGMLEIITGEFIEQLRREFGATEEFSIPGVSIGASTLRGADLIQQGATRLAPYLKSTLPMMSEGTVLNSTSDKDTEFSLNEEVW